MRVRTRSLIPTIAVGLVMVGMILPVAVLGQASNSIRLVLQGGPAPGTYDLATDQPCLQGSGGPGDWSLSITDHVPAPWGIQASFNDTTPEYDFLRVSFTRPDVSGITYESSLETPAQATIDDRGDALTLTLTAPDVVGFDAAGADWSGGSAVLTVNCNIVLRSGDAAPTDTPQPPPPMPTVPPGGAWSGTVTVTGTVGTHEQESGTTGDPGSTYFDTFVRDDRVDTQATDTLTVGGSDPRDLTYGIHEVVLFGGASNGGSTDERYVTTWKKQNSGCTWTEEVGDATSGSWTATGAARGDLRLFDDGTYEIDIHADRTGPDGFLAPDPQLPHRNWDAISDRSAGCEGDGWDTPSTQPPFIIWASDHLGALDVDRRDTGITGQLDVNDPGSVVEGSLSWEMSSPEGLQLTVEWHLVHDGPITLPHS